MNFFKEERLFRVEIVKICRVITFMNALLSRSYGSMPSPDSFKKGSKTGCIPVGTKGWIIKKWGMEYFTPDKDQQGVDLFSNVNDSGNCLIPHRKVKEFYKKIS